ncbi:hypothetical protein bcgnr5372_26870 [Bacillus luti]|nr:hypothetical protein [Bacillus cereus]HDR8331426.1 hypothetical protein [Bacillus cereus]HDR8336595.1 hypothetical protein [Bacillus cereus]
MTIKMEKQVVVTRVMDDMKKVEFGYIQYSEKFYKEVDENDNFKPEGLGLLETDLPEHFRKERLNGDHLELWYEKVGTVESHTKRFKYARDLFTVYVPALKSTVILREEEIEVHIQTTQEYFNKTTEELSVDRGNSYTREDCLVLDDGVKVHFYEKEASLKEAIEYYLNDKHSELDIKAVLKTIDNRYALIMY